MNGLFSLIHKCKKKYHYLSNESLYLKFRLDAILQFKTASFCTSTSKIENYTMTFKESSLKQRKKSGSTEMNYEKIMLLTIQHFIRECWITKMYICLSCSTCFSKPIHQPLVLFPQALSICVFDTVYNKKWKFLFKFEFTLFIEPTLTC